MVMPSANGMVTFAPTSLSDHSSDLSPCQTLLVVKGDWDAIKAHCGLTKAHEVQIEVQDRSDDNLEPYVGD